MSDNYWDLNDINPNAKIEPVFDQAYMGYALVDGVAKAVYDRSIALDVIVELWLLQDEDWITKVLKALDGKVKMSEVDKKVKDIAYIDGVNILDNLVNQWDEEDKMNAPILLVMPKMMEAQIEDDDEIFRLKEDE